MPRTIKTAALQMDARLAPAPARLRRAESLIETAAGAGAQLVALPELFNSGYAYSDENYARAEPLDGPTVAWMKETAADYEIHLAGSLLLRDGGEIYNALLLLAPDGRMWRYDKRYPWGWERAYFRAGRGLTVAETDLGDIGLMICWDAAHRDLWRGYAGQVDLVLISSCPPDVTNPTYHFPDGDTITLDDFGHVGGVLKNTARRLFGPMINAQTACLGVPAVVTVGCGHLRTAIPRGRATLLSYLSLAPHLIKYLPQAGDIEMTCGFVQGCKIVDSRGEVLTELTQEEGESFALADVTLADEKPGPTRPQPKSLLPWLTYLSSDVVLPSLMRPFCRRGVRNLHR